MESSWHGDTSALVKQSYVAENAHRTDFYVGTNMFLYYSQQQVLHKDYMGPDIFFVIDGVQGDYPRLSWMAWEEKWRLPDVVIELLSPSTKAYDLGEKKRKYEQELSTSEYFCVGYEVTQLQGWRLTETSPGVHSYKPISSNANGWLWSEKLGLWLGAWYGLYGSFRTTWLRLYHPDGSLVLLKEERAEQARKAERIRAERAEQAREAEYQRAEQEKQERLRLEALVKQLMDDKNNE